MMVYAIDAGEIDAYVRHLSKHDLNKLMNPRTGVVIEELANDNEIEANVPVVKGGRLSSVNARTDGVVNKKEDGRSNVNSDDKAEDDDFDGVVYMPDDEAEDNGFDGVLCMTDNEAEEGFPEY